MCIRDSYKPTGKRNLEDLFQDGTNYDIVETEQAFLPIPWSVEEEEEQYKQMCIRDRRRPALSDWVRIGRRSARSDNRNCCGRTSDTCGIGKYSLSDGSALR